MEIFKALADYGIAIAVMGIMLYWFAKILTPKVEQNTQSIVGLTQAITALTDNTSKLYETCERAFEDNRNTIQLLVKHIEHVEHLNGETK